MSIRQTRFKIMKSTFVYTLAIFITLSFATEAAISKGKPPRKNKKFLIKPSRPHIKVFAPVNIKPCYVWLEGHWKWNRRTHNYIWVNGYLVKSKRGKVWVGGNWKPKNGGWTYISGKWA
jgi:hypothetical protein